MPQLLRLCEDLSVEVRENAVTVLANALFFHEGNRRRVGRLGDATRTLVRLCTDGTQSHKIHEGACRALGTAAHNDAVALQAGKCCSRVVRALVLRARVRGFVAHAVLPPRVRYTVLRTRERESSNDRTHRC